jgi:hypothetical protein
MSHRISIGERPRGSRINDLGTTHIWVPPKSGFPGVPSGRRCPARCRPLQSPGAMR